MPPRLQPRQPSPWHSSLPGSNVLSLDFKMNPIERLLMFLWDRRGERQRAQNARIQSTHRRVEALKQAEREAARQVVETQRVVSRHRALYDS